MSKRLASSLILIASLLAAGRSAPAQSANAPPGADAEEGGGSGGLQEVVVTARRRDENLQSVPVAVTAYSADSLAMHNITSIDALGAFTPSLSFSSSTYGALGANVAIRGQRPNDLDLSQTPAVGIYVDDVYQSSTMGLSAVSLADATSVEVLKGPQGTLYGRNTTGGAVKITTGLPDLEKVTGVARVGGGNESDVRAYGSISVPVITERLALSVTANYDRNDGYGRDTLSNTNIGDTYMRSVNAALRLQINDQFQAILRGSYVHASSGGLLYSLTAVVPGGGLNTIAAFQQGYGLNPAGFAQGLAYLQAHYVDQPGFDRQYNGPLYQDIYQATGSLMLQYDINSQLTVKSITAFQRISDSMSGDNDGTPFRTVDGNFENMYTRQYTEELQVSGTAVNGRLKYTGGYYYYRLPGTETAFADILFPLLGQTLLNDNDIADRSNSGYGQATYSILPTLRATAGVRFTDETTTLTTRNEVAFPTGMVCNVPTADTVGGECKADYSTHSSNWSYTASLDYDLADAVLLYVKTSRGYKAGGINQRGNVNGGFNTFLPEQVTDYETGTKAEFWDHRLRLDLAAYYSKYNDIQRTVLVQGIGGAPETAVLNAANADIKGLELELTVKPLARLTLSATGSYTDAGYSRYVDPLTQANYSDHVFPGVPRWQGSLSAAYDYPVPVGVLTGSVDYSYQSKVNYSPDNNLPPSDVFPQGTAPYTSQGGYGLVNGRLALNLTGPEFTIALWGRNLANRIYFNGGDDFAGTVGYSTLFIGQPRIYGVELTKRL
jgi:iron complex outermembrane receptor protein